MWHDMRSRLSPQLLRLSTMQSFLRLEDVWGVGLRGFSWLWFMGCFFLPSPLSTFAAFPPLSPRHSVRRHSKVTTQRPFFALYRSLKGEQLRNARRKNGRISRKAEDKVAQNVGLAELCKRGVIVRVRCVCADEGDGQRGSFFPAVPRTQGTLWRPGAF